ncbi:MAG: hypothetical protein IJE43_01455 [Alphaproteobacteria bacterium]|nr:hypothetical protein [Alphaproteobacteria bacterium]
MKKILKLLNYILEFLFPSIPLRKANKKIEQSNNDVCLVEKEVTLEALEKQYNDTFETKSIIEGKAKTNLVTITIAITLIMGSFDLLSSINNKYNNVLINWAVFIIFFSAVLYLFWSGVLALKTLLKENKMDNISLESLSLKDDESKQEYYKCIKKNSNNNIKRNNIVFVSYQCIRNAIICVMIMFILIAIPFNTPNQLNQEFVDNQNQIYYSDNALNYVNSSEKMQIVSELINNDLLGLEEDLNYEYRTFINEKYQILIKYKKIEDKIIVELVEPFVEVQTIR